MFVVDLRDLREGPLAWEEEAPEPEEVWSDLEVEFRGAVRLRAEATLARGGGVHLEGRLEVPVGLSCRRCLADLDRRLDVPLDLWFRPESEDVEKGGGVVFDLASEARKVDLVPALREELVLAIPAFPECEDECSGLCPRCGARLDEEECDCTFEEPDPRWDALRALR